MTNCSQRLSILSRVHLAKIHSKNIFVFNSDNNLPCEKLKIILCYNMELGLMINYQSYYCTYSKPGPGIQWFEMSDDIDIGGYVDHHCLHFLKQKLLIIYFSIQNHRAILISIEYVLISIPNCAGTADTPMFSFWLYSEWQYMLLHTHIDILNLISLTNAKWHLTFRSFDQPLDVRSHGYINRTR